MSDAFYILNEQSPSPIFLIADHASRNIPDAYNNLGVEDLSLLRRHVAWDIGIEDVTRRMAERMNCAAIFSRFSRLLIDANRYLDDPASMPHVSDGVVVPANQNITDADRQQRIESYFKPYHARIVEQLDLLQSRSALPIVISMHSFTPIMNDFERPWHIGVLWDQDGRIAQPMLEILQKNPTLVVGDNEPYSAREPFGYTMNEHGTRKQIPHVVVEIRQDLIDTHQGAEYWANIMVDVLHQIQNRFQAVGGQD